MSFTLKLLGRFLLNLMVLVFILSFLWLNYLSFTVPVGTNEFTLVLILWTMDVIILVVSVMVLFEYGYIFKWWDSINQFFIKRVDPVTIKICDFLNRRNGGCKEE